MGLLWWKNTTTTTTATTTATQNSDNSKPPQQPPPTTTSGGGEVAGMNGAEVVNRTRPTEMTIFEFGSVGASADKVTLAGYCPVSEDLEPCRWEILTGQEPDAPQFRVVF